MSTLKLRNIVVATIVASGGLFVSENMTTSPSQSLVTQAEAQIGRPGTALSVAGVARRNYRRAAVAGAIAGGALAAGYGYGYGTGYPYYGYTSPYYGSSYGYGYSYPSYGTYGYSSYSYPYTYASYGLRRWWW